MYFINACSFNSISYLSTNTFDKQSTLVCAEDRTINFSALGRNFVTYKSHKGNIFCPQFVICHLKFYSKHVCLRQYHKLKDNYVSCHEDPGPSYPIGNVGMCLMHPPKRGHPSIEKVCKFVWIHLNSSCKRNFPIVSYLLHMRHNWKKCNLHDFIDFVLSWGLQIGVYILSQNWHDTYHQYARLLHCRICIAERSL